MEDSKYDKLDSKLDHINDKIGNIDVTLAKQSVLLDEHIRRTNLLEAKLSPVEKHVSMVQGAIKLIVGLAGSAGVIKLILKMYGV